MKKKLIFLLLGLVTIAVPVICFLSLVAHTGFH